MGVGNGRNHAIQRRLRTVEVVQYIGGYSVHRGDNISTVGDSFSTVEVVRYKGNNISTCWGITSVLWRGSFNAVGGGDDSSTCGDSFSTVGEYLQYCRSCSVQWGIGLVLWSAFSTLGGYLQYMQVDNISTVERI